ncbi:MAG: ABC transporter substrate-binding protein [Candidatus Eremiobacteraeota bacterium]|nr:ABC transporter substrate-binding protein [Candidatus Eremiobacteraeota bacterium]
MFKRIALAALLCASAGCSENRTHATAGPHHRVVSLIPSMTEDLFAVGAGSSVIAVDRFSGDPSAGGVPAAASLPVVGDFASIDAEKILTLHPDLIVGIPSQARLVAPLQRAGIDVALLRDDTLDDVYHDIERIGALTGNGTRASTLVTALQARTRALRASVHFRKRPRAFIALTAMPIYTAGDGSYIATLIALAGAVNAPGNIGSAYAPYGPEALLRLQPDAILAPSDAHLDAVLNREPWRSLDAVRAKHVFFFPPAVLEHPGPRYNEGLQWLIERLTPLAR